MPKHNLKFDIGTLRDRVQFLELVSTDDGYGGTVNDWVSVLETWAQKRIKSKTDQAQTTGGAFEFYQVHTFIIRDRVGFLPKKDMKIIHKGIEYIIRGFASLENNPNYIQIYTSNES